MEHKRYDQTPFGLNIISILEKEVQAIVKENFKDDNCPPIFWISLNNEDINNQCIMITINHLGNKFTERLFPRLDTEYGYKSLISQMIDMYNQTM